METYHTPGTVRLRLSLAAGWIRIATVDGGDTEVDVRALHDDEHTRRVASSIEKEARSTGSGEHEVRVIVPEAGRWLPGFGLEPEFGITVTAPHGCLVDAQTSSADVAGSGAFGALEATTASGDVTFGAIDGPASVHSASGDVSIVSVAGDCMIRTVSGDVRLDEAAGTTSLTAVSGCVLIREARGSVAVKTVSGDIGLTRIHRDEVKLRSVSGDIEVAVARGAKVWMDVTSMSGSTKSELDVSAEPEGEGGAELEIRASSVSGDIRVMHAAADG
jgi:Putative adhesin